MPQDIQMVTLTGLSPAVESFHMAALAVPISQLAPVVDEAKAETKCVVVCTKAERADATNMWQIVRKTFRLRNRFAHIVARQDEVIKKLVSRDFSSTPADELSSLASSIDSLVADERDLLHLVNGLGAEIRVWWASLLVKLADQLEYLDSISESLHTASDPEASMLLGLAVEQMAAAG